MEGRERTSAEFASSTTHTHTHFTDHVVVVAPVALNPRVPPSPLLLLLAGKLKLKCGSQFTSKMEGMMNDLAIGGDHEAAFGKYLKDGQESGKIDVEKIDFNVQVRKLRSFFFYAYVHMHIRA